MKNEKIQNIDTFVENEALYREEDKYYAKGVEVSAEDPSATRNEKDSYYTFSNDHYEIVIRERLSTVRTDFSHNDWIWPSISYEIVSVTEDGRSINPDDIENDDDVIDQLCTWQA